MSNFNLFNKKIKKQILYINDFIERNFNKIKYLKSNYKEILLNKENRLILIIGAVVILTLSYFLIPTFYDKNVIQTQIKNQINKNYGVKVKFNEKLNYGLLPKPHFFSNNLSIVRNGKKIGSSKTLKVFIGIGQFFSFENDGIDIKDLVFDKTDFNVYLNDLFFFENLLKTPPNSNKIIFKQSKIFFKNEENEVLFINKIKNGEFYYDYNNFQNLLVSKNEVFKIPYKLTIKNDKFNKKILTNFNSKKIRLNIDSETDYDNEVKKGLLDIIFISKSTSLNYQVKKNSLNFFSKKNKNNYNGFIDFKPFYFSSNFNYEGLSFKNLLNDDSIFYDLIKSQLFNNINLNVNVNLNVKDVVNVRELNNLSLKIGIEEGYISLTNSNIFWKDDLKITLKDCVISDIDNDIIIVGKVKLDMIDIDNFYRSFQINKNYRKSIKEIEFDFVHNLTQNETSFDNIIIDKKSNENIDEFIFSYNLKKGNEFNRITFMNFISSFFKSYAG